MLIPPWHSTFFICNKKYIRIELGDNKYPGKRDLLKDLAADINIDGKYSESYLWIEVLPMEWIVDDAEKALVAKECLVAGIDLDAKKIQEFLDNMLKELTALEKEEQLEVDKRDARIKELKIFKSIS